MGEFLDMGGRVRDGLWQDIIVFMVVDGGIRTEGRKRFRLLRLVEIAAEWVSVCTEAPG